MLSSRGRLMFGTSRCKKAPRTGKTCQCLGCSDGTERTHALGHAAGLSASGAAWCNAARNCWFLLSCRVAVMKAFNTIIAAAAASTALFSTFAFGQSFRCKSDLANVGESKASVFQKCGEPVFKDAFCKPSSEVIKPNTASGETVVNVLPCENVDEWTYNPGYGQFMTTLRFEAGKLVSIKYGDRVK